jgi:hypothetical protein
MTVILETLPPERYVAECAELLACLAIEFETVTLTVHRRNVPAFVAILRRGMNARSAKGKGGAPLPDLIEQLARTNMTVELKMTQETAALMSEDLRHGIALDINRARVDHREPARRALPPTQPR